jgi:hypothetical protein
MVEPNACSLGSRRHPCAWSRSTCLIVLAGSCNYLQLGRRRLCIRRAVAQELGGMPDAPPIVTITGLSKTYASGFQALKRVDLTIRRGEIFALLGPNGAGKTTLISIICGIVNATEGSIAVGGHDIIADYRAARSMIGLVPQELHTDAFETVWATVRSTGTSRPAFCALAIDLELAPRPTFTWTPESLRLREWACPCEP